MAIIGSVFLSLENLSLTLNKAFLYQWSSIVPPPTFLADPEVEKTKCTEEMEPVALHYEISDTTPYVSETKEEKVMLSQSEPEFKPDLELESKSEFEPESKPEVHSDTSRGTVIIHTPETSLFEVNSQKTPDDPIPFEMDQGGLPLICTPF